MINKIKARRNRYMNKKGASMMEFFVITLVVLLIGAAVFIVGKTMKGKMENIESTTNTMDQTLSSEAAAFNDFNSKR